ncbi:MAG: hypothetical protein J6Z31_08200 [Fibrobacter sp.]|nr:hypothetical protein [Fibrobacter sp.]
MGEECPKPLVNENAVISLEGRFINREFKRVHVDIIWLHRPNSADTFDISITGKESYRYISAKEFRYMEFKQDGVRRLMAMHHLKENVGESPLKWDDFELLAQGNYLCYDSLHNDSTVLYTSRSQAWYTISKSLTSEPDFLQMKGPRGESRKLYIHAWKKYDGLNVPTIIDFEGDDYSGSLWTRAAFRFFEPAKEVKKPIQEARYQLPTGLTEAKKSMFGNGLDSEVKIPLILQVH